MVDVVGLRFVTEGETKALAALDRYQKGFQSLGSIQERYTATMNREMSAQVRAVAQAFQRKQRYLQEEQRAIARRDAEDRRAFQQYLNIQQAREQAAREAARAEAQAAAEQQRVAQANAEVARAFGQAVVAANTYTTANKSAADSAAVFARELAQQEQATARAARETQQFLQTLLRIDQPYKEASASADVFVQAQQRAAQSYARLQASINPTIAAQQRMRQVHETVRAALNAEIITREEAARTLRDYRAQAQMTAVATNAMGGGARFAGRRMSNMGVIVQQSGYQIGDFLVQVQSGTNAFVAFGQQATQVVGTLTLLGGKWVLLGTVLGVAIPLLTAAAAAVMRTNAAAREASEGVDILADNITRARREIAEMAFEIEAMQRGFEDMAEFALVRGIEQAQERVRELTGQIYELQQLGTVTGPNERELAAAQESLRLLQEQLETYRSQREEQERLRAIEDARQALLDGYTETIRSLSDAYAFLREQAEGIGDAFKQDAADAAAALEQKIAEAAEEAARAAQQSREVKEQLAEAKRQAELLAAVDMKSSIAEAADEAARVARNLAAAQARIISMRQQGSGRGGDPRVPVGPDPARFDWTESGALEGADAFLGLGTGGGGGGGASQAQEDYLLRLQQEADLRLSLIGLSEEEQRYLEISNELRERGLPIEEERIRQLIATEEELRRATEAEARRQSLMDTVTQSIETALMGLIDGSKSVEEAFTGMIRAILQEIAMQAIVKPIASAITSSIFANGGVFSGGNVVPFADGGVIGSPMTFPLSGGRTGLMGEAGPEAIMPLKRGKDGKLGVVAESGGNVTVQNHFHIAANGDESVKRIISQEAPKIAALTQRQIVDQRRRGGAMKGAFG